MKTLPFLLLFAYMRFVLFVRVKSFCKKKKQTALMTSLTLLLALLNPDQISCWISLFIQPLLPDCSFITVKSNICHLLLYQLKLFMNAYWMFIISIYWKRHNSRIVKTKVCSRLQTSNQYSSITKNDKFLPLIIRGVIKTPPKTLWRIVLQEQSTAESR